VYCQNGAIEVAAMIVKHRADIAASLGVTLTRARLQPTIRRPASPALLLPSHTTEIDHTTGSLCEAEAVFVATLGLNWSPGVVVCRDRLDIMVTWFLIRG